MNKNTSFLRIGNFKIHNLYLLTLGLLFGLYALNDLATIRDIKIFYFLIPIVLLSYFYIKKLPNSQLLKSFSLLIAFIAVNQFCSLFFSPVDLEYIFYSNIRYFLVLLLIFPIIGMYNKNKSLLDILILWSAFVLAISSFYIFFVHYSYLDRFSGTFSNPNDFSLLIVFLVYYVFYYMQVNTLSKKVTLLLSILVLSLSLLIILTLSRSGIIILFLLLFFYFFSLRRQVKLTHKVILFILSAMAITALISIFDSDMLRVFERFTSDEGQSSTSKRFLQINAAFSVMNSSSFNWLFGMGTSATGYTEWFRLYYPVGYSDAVHVIHNSYLAVLVHHGLIGFSLYLFFMSIVFYKIIRLRHSFKYTMLGYFIAVTLFSQAAYTIYFLPYWLSFVMLALHADNLKLNSFTKRNQKKETNAQI